MEGERSKPPVSPFFSGKTLPGAPVPQGAGNWGQRPNPHLDPVDHCGRDGEKMAVPRMRRPSPVTMETLKGKLGGARSKCPP